MNTHAKISAWVAGITTFITWLVSLPPENQDALIKPMIELTPLEWRPTIGFVTRILASASTIYGIYKMRPNPPQNKPIE